MGDAFCILPAAVHAIGRQNMRNTIVVTTFLIAAASAVGCTSKDDKSAARPKQQGSAAVRLDKAKAETKEAAQAMRDYAYAEKAEFVDRMKKELVSMQEELDRLGAKADKASDGAKADAKVKLEAAREKWTQAKKQLDRAESATESTWDDVKNGFKRSYADLQDSFTRTRQWLSDKIAP
jgi:Skp family chaperone for outer membrane proteins